MNKLLLRLDSEINYLFFRRLRYRRMVKRHLMPFYSRKAAEPHNGQKTAIYMADGRVRHGGLADRLRGMTSLYSSCMELGIDFRIYFVSPFRLDTYLQPAAYDWRISDEEVSYNSKGVKVFFADCRRDRGPREERWQKRTLLHYLRKKYRQAHVYTNFVIGQNDFGRLFNQLFKPSGAVERRLAQIVPELGEKYVSVSTRFLQMLGDFKEPDASAPAVDPQWAEYLLQRCLDALDRIAEKECADGRKLLVTSDSTRFLEAAAGKPYVYVISGTIAHMDVAQGHDDNADMKTFVDFFAIARAERSYLLTGMGLYNSNFSLRAAQAGNHEFIKWEIKP